MTKLEEHLVIFDFKMKVREKHEVFNDSVISTVKKQTHTNLGSHFLDGVVCEQLTFHKGVQHFGYYCMFCCNMDKQHFSYITTLIF